MGSSRYKTKATDAYVKSKNVILGWLKNLWENVMTSWKFAWRKFTEKLSSNWNLSRTSRVFILLISDLIHNYTKNYLRNYLIQWKVDLLQFQLSKIMIMRRRVRNRFLLSVIILKNLKPDFFCQFLVYAIRGRAYERRRSTTQKWEWLFDDS